MSLTNPDEAAYEFASMTENVTLDNADDKKTVNFGGTHTRTASISGVLFIDEVMQDKMHTTGEPTITEALAPWLAIQDDATKAMVAGLLTQAKVIVRGPSLDDPPTEVPINADGSFTTGEALVAGSYQVELPANNEMVAAALYAAGIDYVGESAVVPVAAGGMATVNFPFEIRMQTISVGAVMGNDEMTGDDVEDVELELYGTAEDAEDGMNPLSEMAGTTDEMGMANFTFARADDSSPAGDDTDNIVFVKVKATGHDDLMVSDNDVIEIQYPGVARVHAAPAHVRLLNVGVYFDFWVKSNETARDGDEGLGGWSTAVVMVDPDAEDDPEPLMMVDEDGDTVNATMPTDDGEDDMDDKGKSTFSYVVDPTMLPATFGVAAVPVVGGKSVQPDMGEMWEQSDPLMHTHTGLDLPLGEDDDMIDLGPIRITFTTQKLTVGVYRETDDEPGFSNYQSKVDGGDQRPSDDVSEELMVELMKESSRGRLTRHEYKAFDSKGKRTVEVSNPMPFAKGLASFKNLPADEEFTVRFHAGSDRMAVVDAESARNGRDVDTYDGDLDDGMSVGAFGDEGGAGPEVRLCPMSSSSKDDMCSTFAYQWASGFDQRRGDAPWRGSQQCSGQPRGHHR